MATMSYAARDSRTMLRRNLKKALRYPSLTLTVVIMPIMMLLLFNYVFGRALGTGISDLPTGSGEYIDYIAPGIILMAATSGALTTAISICIDKTEGIVNRFRTMPVSRASFLTGHVVAGVIQTMTSVVLVIGAALLMGFRPDATVVEWAAAIEADELTVHTPDLDDVFFALTGSTTVPAPVSYTHLTLPTICSV